MSPSKRSEPAGALAGIAVHAGTVDFQSGLVNERVVADEIIGCLIGEFDNEIKYRLADPIDGQRAEAKIR